MTFPLSVKDSEVCLWKLQTSGVLSWDNYQQHTHTKAKSVEVRGGLTCRPGADGQAAVS